MMYTTYFQLAYIKKSTYMGQEREGQRERKKVWQNVTNW